MTADVLAPKVGTFAPGEPIVWASEGDPLVRVLGPCGPNACMFGYVWEITATPFAAPAVDHAMLLYDDEAGSPIGFTHGFSATGPAVPPELAERPWVFSWNLQYCLSPYSCANGDTIEPIGGGLHFAGIMLPQ
jgi:hypothetical protein